MRDLMMSEMRRALHRRVVWVLVGLALVGISVLGAVAFFDSAGRSVAELRKDGTHPAVMADWWVSGGGEGILMIAALPLVLGAVFGGASVIGAEWRSGTVTTVLTWEPRRLRLHVARMTAAALLATAIAFVLEAVFLAATIPAVLAHGTTAGTDAGWWLGLLAAIVRIAVITGVAALLAASLATLGRSSAFAMAATFAWLAIVENLIRGWNPRLTPHLIGENLSVVITWAQLESVDVTRPGPVAAIAIAAYCGAVALVTAVSFARRDVAGVG